MWSPEQAICLTVTCVFGAKKILFVSCCFFAPGSLPHILAFPKQGVRMFFPASDNSCRCQLALRGPSLSNFMAGTLLVGTTHLFGIGGACACLAWQSPSLAVTHALRSTHGDGGLRLRTSSSKGQRASTRRKVLTAPQLAASH
jgi:hypothetical protein